MGNVLRSMEERGHREMKCRVKFKEELNGGMRNRSEQIFGGCVLRSIWFRFFSCGNVLGCIVYPTMGKKEIRQSMKENLNSVKCKEPC